MPWLYILKCRDGSYYTGTAANPEKRLAEHQQGLEGSYTYNKRPVELVFANEFPSWPEAIAREIQIKKWSRKKKEALIKEDWEALKRLSKGKK
ncbi:MAG: GIY-YIG nuclease family protein [Deltaproteobacteria bacterium]|nr:GIY-YIG nuclease family protein [Deltaproteobacteria bacterium]